MFDFSNLLKDILYIVLTAIAPIVVTYFTKYVDAKIEEMTANIESEKIKKYIESVSDAISIAVTSVSQTYVDSLKASGQFDKEAQAKAKELAMDTARKLITQNAQDTIDMIYGDFNEYLESAIESYVRASRTPNVQTVSE